MGPVQSSTPAFFFFLLDFPPAFFPFCFFQQLQLKHFLLITAFTANTDSYNNQQTFFLSIRLSLRMCESADGAVVNA
jgi:hypothetical protein